MSGFGTLRGMGPRANDRWWDLRAMRFVLDDGTGAAIATGAKTAYQSAPCDLQIVRWRLMANTSTTTVLDVWADRAFSFPPLVADTIAGGDKPSLSAGTFAESDRLTGWRAVLEAGEVVELNVDSNNNAVRAVLELFYLPLS